MLPILIACLIWLPALVGLGSPLAGALRRVLGGPVCSVAIHTALTGLLGIFVASTIAAAVNFWVAIYPVVSSSILLLGWAFAIRYRQRWLRLPTSAWQLSGIILLVISLIDARGLAWYDTGLYHLQAVRWLTGRSVPAGLANLFGCLGYNCSWFTFAAAVETPLLLGKSCFVVNELIAFLFALPALDALLRCSGKCIRPSRVILGLMLIPMAYLGVDVGMISSLAPDPAVMLLTLFSLALWVKSPRFSPQILTLACFAVTIKLSALPLLIMSVIAAVAWAVRFPGILRKSIPAAAFCGFSAIVFLVRGYWLSGYPAYPSVTGRIPSLRWTAPTSVAMRSAGDIESWPRYHKVSAAVTPGTPWLGGWMHRVGLSEPMLIAYAVFLTGVLIAICRRRRLTKSDARCVAAAIGLLPAIAFWFITAPQVRFGYGYIFALASLSLTLGISTAKLPMFTARNFRRGVAIAVICLLLCMHVDRQLLKLTLLRWPGIPVANLEAHRTKDGLIVQMPQKDDRVWNASTPATPELDPDLRCEKDAEGTIRKFYFVGSH